MVVIPSIIENEVLEFLRGLGDFRMKQDWHFFLGFWMILIDCFCNDGFFGL